MSTCRRSMKRIAYFILSASVAHLVFLNLSEGPAGRVGVDVPR